MTTPRSPRSAASHAGASATDARAPFVPGIGIGTPLSTLVLAFQQQAAKLIEKADGDDNQLLALVLSELESRGLIHGKSRQHLGKIFDGALEVSAGQGDPIKALGRARSRHAAIIADREASDVARTLAELGVWTISEAAAGTPSEEDTPGVLFATRTGRVRNRATQMLLWAGAGALVGAETAGLPGALIGAAVGAVVGACGNETTVTTTTPS